MPRQIGRLVEAALPSSRRVQRNRHGRAGADEHVGTPIAHEGRETRRQRAAGVVLERVHDGAKRALVRADGARGI